MSHDKRFCSVLARLCCNIFGTGNILPAEEQEKSIWANYQVKSTKVLQKSEQHAEKKNTKKTKESQIDFIRDLIRTSRKMCLNMLKAREIA